MLEQIDEKLAKILALQPLDYKEALLQVLQIRQSRQQLYDECWRDSKFVGNVREVMNKVGRLGVLLDKDIQGYETAKDTLIDAINYALFSIACMAGDKK